MVASKEKVLILIMACLEKKNRSNKDGVCSKRYTVVVTKCTYWFLVHCGLKPLTLAKFNQISFVYFLFFWTHTGY